MPSSQFSKFAATVALLILLSTIAAAQFQIGSSNTAFAAPPVQPVARLRGTRISRARRTILPRTQAGTVIAADLRRRGMC